MAHQIEAYARQKTLKPLQHYLDKATKPEREAGAAGVLAMLKRFKARQDAKAAKAQT